MFTLPFKDITMLSRLQIIITVLTSLICTDIFADETFEFSMNNVEMREFIASVGKITNRTIVVDPSVKGNVNINSRKALSAAEVYEIFLSQLQAHGYAAVLQGDNILKVVLGPKAKLEGGLVYDNNDKKAEVSDAIVTRVINLKTASASELLKTLRPLVDTRNGAISAYTPTNTIIVTDRSANIRRLLDIAQSVDKNASRDVETIPLQRSSAPAMAQLLSSLLKQNQGDKPDAISNVQIAYDQDSNSIILRGRKNERQMIRNILAELDQNHNEQDRHQVLYLKYADAKNLKAIIQGSQQQPVALAGNASNSRQAQLSVEIDEDINALILTGPSQAVKEAKSLVKKLDIRRAQVLIEAIIVEINDTLSKELGVQWLLGKDGKLGGGLTSSAGNINAAALLSGLNSNNDTQLGSILSQAKGLNLVGGRLNNSGINFGVLLSALAENKDSNILSTPSLLVIDNEEASILVGQEVPFITGSTTGSNNSNPFQTIDRREVGIKLKVKPQINDGNAIQLTIEQEVSSLSGLQATDLITNKRTLHTTVLAEDGAIVVLGGLMDEQIQLVNSKIPLLGDIPLLGRLFRTDSTQKTKRNLLIFIRPMIVRDPQLLQSISENKYQYIRAEQLLKQQIGVPLLDKKIIPILPLLQESL